MHRYILEPYSGMGSRIMCPQCKHRRDTFKRYIDTQTQSYLADHVGRCDMQEQCGYHYPPRQYFADNPGLVSVNSSQLAVGNSQLANCKPPTANLLLPWEMVEQSMKAYHRNNFVQFLVKLFGVEKTKELVLRYCIGTASHWPGASVFWQLDYNEQVRGGKVMLYATTGKRVKEPYNHITSVHHLLMRNANCQMRNELTMRNANCQMRNEEDTKTSAIGIPTSEFKKTSAIGILTSEFKKTSAIGIPTSEFKKTSAIGIPTSDFKIKQCLFGEHLLSHEPDKIVALTESEKTAVIGSAMEPGYVWLAVGSLDGLNPAKCKILQHRTVLLYPDVNGYSKWKAKARELNPKIPTATFGVNKWLLRNANPADIVNGADIADKWIEQLLTIKP